MFVGWLTYCRHEIIMDVIITHISPRKSWISKSYYNMMKKMWMMRMILNNGIRTFQAQLDATNEPYSHLSHMVVPTESNKRCIFRTVDGQPNTPKANHGHPQHHSYTVESGIEPLCTHNGNLCEEIPTMFVIVTCIPSFFVISIICRANNNLSFSW